MNPIRLDIPSLNPANEAARIVMDRLKEHGIDVKKAVLNPLMRDACIFWSRGEMGDDEFDRICTNMKVLCPALCLEPRT